MERIKYIMDDNMVITAEDANALHKMYEVLRKVLETQSIRTIRMTIPRDFAENWIRSYEKLRHFMDVNKIVRTS